jgi:dihydrofolate reductase
VSVLVLYMSMSLDGYIAGPNDEPANPGGDGFDRLHDWIVTPDGEFGRPARPAGQLWDEWTATGAVLAGRRTVEQIDHWEGDAHGVPIFVPSHRPPCGLRRVVGRGGARGSATVGVATSCPPALSRQRATE